MPPPHTLEPRVELLAVGICTTGPTPHSQPLTGFLGERNAENVVGPVPNGTVWIGCSDGCQISGRMVRVMMFQSAFTWIGITGDFLCALVRAVAEVGVALEREAVEVADRVLQLLGK